MTSSFPKMLVLFAGGLQKISGAIKNWGRWSEIVAVRFSAITSFEIKLKKILSIKVLELLFILVGSKTYDKNIINDKECKNSLMVLFCPYYNKLMLKSSRRKVSHTR